MRCSASPYSLLNPIYMNNNMRGNERDTERDLNNTAPSATREMERENSEQRSEDSSKNPGNFANDPQRAAEVGRKGGQHSHQGRSA